MKITLLYFAQFYDAMGKRTEEIELPEETTIRRFYNTLLDRPDRKTLRDLPVRFAVNEDVVNDNFVLKNGDCLAILPPVAGG